MVGEAHPTDRMNASPTETRIQIKYMVSLREQAGRREEEVDFPPGATLGDLVAWLRAERDVALPDPQIMTTLNGKGWEQFSQKLDTELKSGDVVCLFPLLSGG